MKKRDVGRRRRKWEREKRNRQRENQLVDVPKTLCSIRCVSRKKNI